MKKPFKIVITTLSVFAAIVVILAVLIYIRFSRISSEMSPSETMALNDTVFCIKNNYVNAYLFKCDSSYVMVDACMSENAVLEELGALGISPSDVKVILLTHTDGDHIGSIGAFPGAMVYMHRDEEQMITGETSKMFFKYRWKFGEYRLLESGEIFEPEGLRVEVIHTPGHTPGSVCYIIGNEYLVSGDNLLFRDGRYAPFMEAVTMDPEENARSISSLPDPSEFKYILSAHSGIIEITSEEVQAESSTVTDGSE